MPGPWALLAGNAILMLFAAVQWYATMPGVPQTGPYNPHFVRDIGAIYLVAAGGLAWFAWRPVQRWPALVGVAAFLTLHSVVHIHDALLSPVGGHDLARDFPGIFLPPLIAGWIAITTKPDPRRSTC